MPMVEEWWKAMPPVTRGYVSLAVLTTAATTLELITPLKLYLNWKLVFTRGEMWRLATTFLFFGTLSIDFLFHMFFIYRYSKDLERNSFRGRTADFLYMVLFGAALLLMLSPLFPHVIFFSFSLSFMMVYVWARRNAHQVMSFFGVITFTAPYLPWFLVAFSYMLGGSLVKDLMGVFVGHVYYYLKDVYPRMTGVQVLKTPKVLHWLVGNENSNDVPRNHGRELFQQRMAAVGANDGWGQGRNLDGPRGNEQAQR